MLDAPRPLVKGLRELAFRDNVYLVTIAPTPEQSEDLARFADALAGQYEIEREIGRGGMGIVYLARDPKLDRRVAIKTLPPHLADDPIVRERFLREARTAGRLSHQNIVPIHRADELHGRVFFVMGYVDGDSMAQRIRDRRRLDSPQAIRQLIDVASALGYAHNHGVIHRDVKAENILLDRTTERAMVTDFGIARLAEASPLTATGQVLGTVYYLSPEQVSGEFVDGRSDIYSLGVVGYFALSGRFPFDAELASAVLIAHVTKTAPPLRSVAPHVSHALADLIDRCLAKDPADRFQNCGELIDALVAIEGADSPMPSGDVEQIAANAPNLISDSEAQNIIGRAAHLQAQTGIEPRPVPLAARRDAARDLSRTSGHRPADIRDAALEAGIPGKYVDHVFEEHGLSPLVAPENREPTITERSKPANIFVGERINIEYEVVVDGEMPEDDYDLLADVIRHTTGESGQLASVGRSFSWQAYAERRSLQVSVLARGGKTTVRVSENLRKNVGGYFGGIVGGVGGGTSSIWLGLGVKFHSPLLGMGLWLGTIAVSYAAARGFFGMMSRSRKRQLKSLAEQLAQQARIDSRGEAEARSSHDSAPSLGTGWVWCAIGRQLALYAVTH